jgi:ATP/maltotriose-dependent transcriptional regulator MalT
MLGNFPEARKHYKESRRIGEAFGLASWLAALPLYSGPVELLAGQPARAASQLRRGYDALERMGDRSRRATVAAFLAHALYEQHKDTEAEKFARISKKLVGGNEDAFTQVVWRGALAKVLARRGDCDFAIQLATEAVGRANDTDGPNLRGDALLDLARVQHACGQSALENAQAAVGEYDKKENIVSKRRADGFIARLGQ